MHKHTTPKINWENFRSYDIRGQYPKEIDDTTAYMVGRAFVKYSGASHVVVGGEVRLSTGKLREALIEGLRDQGADITNIGLSSTDALYFATHNYKEFEAGIMITASHMPKQYNGFKFLDQKLRPIGRGSGMKKLYKLAKNQNFGKVKQKGDYYEKNIWLDFREFVLSFVNLQSLKEYKVVMDAGNGMAGYVAERVYKNLPIQMIPIFFEPDGRFPNHNPNPLLPENREDLVNKVRETNADLGVAWDADCDRVFFVDEKGEYVDGDFVTALVALHMLKKHPGAGIVYDIRTSHAVPNLIKEAGGIPHAEKVGYVYIKQKMREVDAVFGGEISGHYYFKRNAYAENSFVVPLMILEMVSAKNKSLSALISEFGDYYISGEINSEVKDLEAVIQKLALKYKDAEHIDYRDGITVEYPDWHFNVRPSSNDPVVRLNLEADSQAKMQQKRDEVLKIIRGNKDGS